MAEASGLHGRRLVGRGADALASACTTSQTVTEMSQSLVTVSEYCGLSQKSALSYDLE